jgi:hypothetical protein
MGRHTRDIATSYAPMKRVLTSAAPRIEFVETAATLPAIALRFGDAVPAVVRGRVTYALQVFAAVYNYRFVDQPDGGGAVVCAYGAAVAGESANCFCIPARYRERRKGERAAQGGTARFRDESVFLFHGIDEASGRPDWLGEIFEWLTASYERESVERDAVGRIPFSASVFAREKMPARKPYANILMAWLQSEIRKCYGGAPTDAPSVSPDADHFVVSSHDIDFYWVRPATAITRLAKNCGIAVRSRQGQRQLRDTASMLGGVLAGRRAGDFLPALLHAGEKWNFRSTLFVVARHGHRRDPDYRLRDLQHRLVEAREAGFDVELHGSYTSIVEGSALSGESQELARAMARRTRGGRQHWLRFDTHEKLFASVAGAGLQYDSTLGFADRVGFRNGASFAFPPYNFEVEAPFDFLEIPLVLMDGSLEAEARVTGEAPATIAGEVLSESRRWGWGGVSVLWHNPIEPLSVPAEINEVFWRCVAQQDRHREKWISASDFLERSLNRYQNAGLLKGIHADA